MLSQWAESVGLVLSAAQLAAFEQFEEDLYVANETQNLTRVPRVECWSRHFVDSLLWQDLIPVGAKLLDLGTGPGFPAWPLACARPDLRVTAADSNGKMLAFLRAHPLPNLEVVNARAEELRRRNAFDVVTGRALAPLAIQLELSVAWCKVGGLLIPMRGASDDLEALDLEAMGLLLEEVVRRELPPDGAWRVFPLYRKMRATSAKIPRRWAEIKAKPMAV